MIFWIVGLLVVFVALLIPILAIVLDSPALHKLVESRHHAPTADLQQLLDRVATLEDEVDDLNGVVRHLRDETQFLNRLLEDQGGDRPELPPPPA